MFRPRDDFLSNEDAFWRLFLSFYCDNVDLRTYMLLLPMRRPVVPEFVDCFNFILLKMCILEGRLFALARLVTFTFYSIEFALS